MKEKFRCVSPQVSMHRDKPHLITDAKSEGKSQPNQPHKWRAELNKFFTSEKANKQARKQDSFYTY